MEREEKVLICRGDLRATYNQKLGQYLRILWTAVFVFKGSDNFIRDMVDLINCIVMGTKTKLRF